jgi:putative endonuclease
MNHFSKKGIPWVLVKTFELSDKSTAIILEKQIKKNGAKRYLERNNIEYNI